MFGNLAGKTWSAINWVLLGGVVLAAIIGLLFITRGTAVHRVRAIEANGIPVAPDEPTFPLTIGLLTGTPIVGGNRVELALDGNGTFP
ncbi:MAG TPA: hypothetical protein VGJ64_00805, partial [Gemmatimonadaceae bacterium]